jgi:4'-phosphopantetheinyl transferase EntD
VIEEILPPRVGFSEMFGDDAAGCLFDEEISLVSTAVAGRRSEFLTARTCARRALQQLGFPAVPIGRGRNREPLWPKNIAGSITHCQGYRAAAVASRSEILSIGIDAEPDCSLPAGLVNRIAFGRERVAVRQLDQRIHWDRLLFSAKESVFKAWFPITNRWIDFEDAEVIFALDTGTFEIRLSEAVTKHISPAARFSGRFLVRAGLILSTVIVLNPDNCSRS